MLIIKDKKIKTEIERQRVHKDIVNMYSTGVVVLDYYQEVVYSDDTGEGVSIVKEEDAPISINKNDLTEFRGRCWGYYFNNDIVAIIGLIDRFVDCAIGKKDDSQTRKETEDES